MAIGGTVAGALGGGGIIGGATVRLVLDSAQFDAGLRAAEGRLATVGRGMSRVGTALTRGVTLPIVAAAGVSVKMALDFETAFNRIDAVTNTSAANLQKWKTGVLDLAGTTAQAPQELAEALYFLASAGLDANQIMPTLEMSAKASASGLGETADIARLTANALNAYAKSGLTAANVTDTLVAAVREGTAEPDEFADAMGRILPIASKAGVSFDEVAASLAGLSNIGLDVNEGVTAMRGLLMALEAPGTQAAQTLSDIGISTDEMRAAIADDGLLGAMRLLNEETGGNIDVMRKIIPNVRALTAQFGLTGQEADKMTDIFHNVANSTGDIDEAFATTAKGPQFKFQQSLAKLQVTAIEVGQEILPAITTIVRKVGDLAAAFNDLSPAAKSSILKIMGIAAVAGPLLKVIGLVLRLGAAFKAVAVATTAVSAGTAAVTAGAGVRGLGQMLAGPIGAVAGGATAATAGTTAAATSTAAVGASAAAAVIPLTALGAALLLVGYNAEQESERVDQAANTIARFGPASKEGQAALRTLLPALKDMGMSVEEIRELVNGLHGSFQDISAEKMRKQLSEVSVEAGRFGVSLSKSQRDLVMSVLKTDGYAAAVAVLKKQLGDLPKSVISKILLPGIDGALNDLRAVRDSIAALPASKVFTLHVRTTGDVGKLGHSGGFVTPAGIFHGGGRVGGGGDVPAILQAGEFVMRRSAVNALGISTMRALNSAAGGGGGGGVIRSSGGGGGTMTIVGVLDTPFGPAEVRGIARQEVSRAAGRSRGARRVRLPV